jgi:hypothetical protein
MPQIFTSSCGRFVEGELGVSPFIYVFVALCNVSETIYRF